MEGDFHLQNIRQTLNADEVSAEAALKLLLPSVAPVVLHRLRRENVRSATDLAGLDKDDLRELGFTMVERSRILLWAREATVSFTSDKTQALVRQSSKPGTPGGIHDAQLFSWRASRDQPIWRRTSSKSFDDTMPQRLPSNRSLESASPPCAALDVDVDDRALNFQSLPEQVDAEDSHPYIMEGQGEADAAAARLDSQGKLRRPSMDDTSEEQADFQRKIDEMEQRASAEERRLDEVERQADFWCNLIVSVPSTVRLRTNSVIHHPGAEEINELDDVRENVLEEMFDLTTERVKEVYQGMVRDKNGRLTFAELGNGLRRCGLPQMDTSALARILDHVGDGAELQLSEFETILSRLKLAQLLQGRIDTAALASVDGDTKNGALVATDFNSQSCSNKKLIGSELRKFIFGHRPLPKTPGEAPLVRWVHMRPFDLTLLLSLMVKYSLHPLGVEDVIEQCPTKMDKYGNHYFAAVEHLCLASPPDGSTPVRVRAIHVALFCSGPPLRDTVVTVEQPDRSFEETWPKWAVEPGRGGWSVCSPWEERLQQRLSSARSRLRERRADFLMHQILDIFTDELLAIGRAYSQRLVHLDEVLMTEENINCLLDWFSEVSDIRVQLGVVTRRIRGMQRVLRNIVVDVDLSTGLSSYLQDVKDHLDEAYDDTLCLVDRIRAATDSYERTLEREQERGQQKTAERLNVLLFFLTVGTAIFAPVQFLAGVYGMNFVTEDGKPGIPELRWEYGYIFFWVLVLVYLVVAAVLAVLLFRRLERRSQDDQTVSKLPMPATFTPGESRKALINCDCEDSDSCSAEGARNRASKAPPRMKLSDLSSDLKKQRSLSTPLLNKVNEGRSGIPNEPRTPGRNGGHAW
mmetsp:Transcript_3836/g.8950  ORF Transcript_3836/g.8950 Transcript_3836/m.8950 type:complete len:863 (+) Transcript_3836:50-2638(+)